MDCNTGKRSTRAIPLVDHLQTVQRPTDIKISHFEALNIHVLEGASAEDIVPWAGYLPSKEGWDSIPQEQLSHADEVTRVPMSNGSISPGLQVYRERQKELLVDNTSAFRTVRRIPPLAGESAARLGNSYEFFKNLELCSGYWPDTSLPSQKQGNHESSGDMSEEVSDGDAPSSNIPRHLQTHIAIGNGAQLPPDHRTQLLHSFTKLVAYPFGCNVTFARTEPRLHLTPSSSSSLSSSASSNPHSGSTTPRAKQKHRPSSHFNSSATFIYRTPTDRASARNGIVEGPLAVLSSRASHTFTLPSDHNLDFAREVVAILLTAQQRSRQHKTERRFGEDAWWTTSPRWGGGVGGPIGREAEARAEAEKAIEEGIASGKGLASAVNQEAKRLIGGINSGQIQRSSSPSPSKRSKTALTKEGNFQMYESYRNLKSPSASWDPKCRYEAIGKASGETYDDIFLISCLNHHVSVVRARVPDKLVEVLEGADEEAGWGKLEICRTKWFDLYLGTERIEALNVIWGVVNWLMRKEGSEKEGELE